MPLFNLPTSQTIKYDIIEEKTADGYYIVKKVLYNKAGEEQIFSISKKKIDDIDAEIAKLQDLKEKIELIKVATTAEEIIKK